MSWTTWDTSHVDENRQFDYYYSGLSESFSRLTPQITSPRKSISADLERWEESGRQFTFFAASIHRVSRTRSDIAAAEDDHFYLNYIQYGEMRFSQFDDRQLLKPGNLTVIDNGNLFDADIGAVGGHRHLAFRMDRRKFSQSSSEISRILRRHELAPALRQSLSYLCRANGDWSRDHIANAVAAVEGLVLTIASAPDVSTDHSRAKATLRKVKEIIAARFGDPHFCLDDVAGTLKVPRRTVQMHLRSLGCTFSVLLLEARLSQAMLLLTSPNEPASVEQVCFQCGFNELSTFYRAFRGRYGNPPGKYRSRIL